MLLRILGVIAWRRTRVVKRALRAFHRRTRVDEATLRFSRAFIRAHYVPHPLPQHLKHTAHRTRVSLLPNSNTASACLRAFFASSRRSFLAHLRLDRARHST